LIIELQSKPDSFVIYILGCLKLLPSEKEESNKNTGMGCLHMQTPVKLAVMYEFETFINCLSNGSFVS